MAFFALILYTCFMKIFMRVSAPICAKALCLLCVVFSLFLSSCTKKLTPEQIELQRKQAIEQAKDKAVSDYVSALPREVKISQLFLVNIEGNERYHAVEKTGVLFGKPESGSPLVSGGVLLFSYNISNDPLETHEYISSIRDFYIKNQNIPPYISVDQEGGYVNRLRSLTSVLWAEKKVADTFSLDGAAQLYSAQARQMKNLGFHLNLAPVIEVENDENKDFLDTRSFGNLEKVLSYGKNCVLAYEENQIATVLKHFPGNSSTDPHSGLPEISVTKKEFEEYYLAPFKNLLPHASAVLMSHARLTITDDESYTESEIPACLSPYWVTQVLRNQLNFTGLIFSDDIFMGALSKNGYPPEKAVVSAIEAGINVIMLSEKKFGSVAKILLETATEKPEFAKKIDAAVEQVIRYKIKAGILDIKEAESAENDEIPQFTVEIHTDYPDFDLYTFHQDYKAGTDIFYE